MEQLAARLHGRVSGSIGIRRPEYGRGRPIRGPDGAAELFRLFQRSPDRVSDRERNSGNMPFVRFYCAASHARSVYADQPHDTQPIDPA